VPPMNPTMDTCCHRHKIWTDAHSPNRVISHLRPSWICLVCIRCLSPPSHSPPSKLSSILQNPNEDEFPERLSTSLSLPSHLLQLEAHVLFIY
jgi:hypothetical protein